MIEYITLLRLKRKLTISEFLPSLQTYLLEILLEHNYMVLLFLNDIAEIFTTGEAMPQLLDEF